MSPGATVFDARPCELGEGLLWHPVRQQLFWFDIPAGRLLSRQGERAFEWQFDRQASAAGWIDADRLIVATETDLSVFDIPTGRLEPLLPLEAERAGTRSNDGRADPHGGFWIGTMGKNADPGAGAIYRYFRGELRRLFPGVTIPNAICFTPDGGAAFFADTARRLVWRQALTPDGWPDGEPRVFLDHRSAGINPDGAVTDSKGRLWCAEWGNARVACHDPSARLVAEVALPVPQPT